MKSLFEYTDYKQYLADRTGRARQRTGQKSALAQAIRCQTTYLSRVLAGRADLSLEQAESANRFFDHGEEEEHYFLILVQVARAATPTLRRYFQKQLDSIRAKRLILRQRLKRDGILAESDQAEYYSSWHYAALHVAVTVPHLRSRAALSRHFRISPLRVARVLDFLERIKLVREEGGEYLPTQNYVMLGNDSPNIIRHHSNWRNQAIHSLEAENPDELHYSAVFSLSRADLTKIKENLMQVIQKNLGVVKASSEEVVFSCCIDFFNLEQP